MVRFFFIVAIFFCAFFSALSVDALYAQELSRVVSLDPDRVLESESSEQALSEVLISKLYDLRSYLRKAWEKRSKNVFSFAEIRVVGNRHVLREQVLSMLDIAERGEKQYLIFTLPFENFSKRLEQIPWIRRAQISWAIFPLRLCLELEEYRAWLIAQYKGNSWLVSEEGHLLEPLSQLAPAQVVEMSGLPRLEGLGFAEDEDLRFFSSERERFKYAVKLIRLVERQLGSKLPIAVFTLLDDGSMRLEPEDSAKYPEFFLRFKNAAELKPLIERYFATLEDLVARDEGASEIDLRFAQQVIVR